MQKGITTSAVQLAVLLSAVVNGGTVFQPQLSAAEGFTAKERWRLPSGTVLRGLADGFLGAVNEGSAAEAFDPDIVVAGKTGTCAGLGWFASYAPADKPEMVMVVFLPSATGHQASSVAGRIYQELYKGTPATVAAGPDGAPPVGRRPAARTPSRASRGRRARRWARPTGSPRPAPRSCSPGGRSRCGGGPGQRHPVQIARAPAEHPST
jgi:membrane peptidoglycan carboxypeptidase